MQAPLTTCTDAGSTDAGFADLWQFGLWSSLEFFEELFVVSTIMFDPHCPGVVLMVLFRIRLRSFDQDFGSR